MGSQKELVKQLKAEGVLKSPAIVKAFLAVDRVDFVLPKYKDLAYENHPLPIGLGQTISQPYTVAFMLELLNVEKGDKILEIGSGSGFKTALLCCLTGFAGRVVGIERLAGLKRLAAVNLAKYPLYRHTGWLIVGDGKLGCSEGALFNKIISAAAGKRIPKAWKEQLKVGGKIVAPVNGSIWEITKKSASVFKIVKHLGFAFVPLV